MTRYSCPVQALVAYCGTQSALSYMIPECRWDLDQMLVLCGRAEESKQRWTWGAGDACVESVCEVIPIETRRRRVGR